jgi:hypothetical protein
MLILRQLAVDEHFTALAGSRPDTLRSGSNGARIAETTIAGANFGSTALPLTTSEPVWKSSPCTSAAPGTCEARTTVRWSISS